METLICGAAQRCITPPEELLPRLRGLKQRRFADVIDDLYVRAVVLGSERRRALSLSFDMTTAPCTLHQNKPQSQGFVVCSLQKEK